MPSIVRWGIRHGQVDRKGGSSTYGQLVMRQYQRGSGTHQNSGPNGKRSTRFYADRVVAKRKGYRPPTKGTFVRKAA